MTNDIPFDRDQDHKRDDVFRQTSAGYVGERGHRNLWEETKTTNLDAGTEAVERVEVAQCTCGAPIQDPAHVHTCVECNELACPLCRLRLHRRCYCPDCAEQAFALDKRVFLSLLFLQKDVLELDDLLHVDTVGDTPVELAIDRAATTLIEHDYVDTETGELTAAGTEALAVGEQLYGEDTDVQSVLQQIRVQEVVDHGRHQQESLYDRFAP